MESADEPGTVLIVNPGVDLYGSDRMMLESVTALVGAGYRVITTVPQDGPLVREIETRGGHVRMCPTPILRKSALTIHGMIRLVATTLGSLSPSMKLLRGLRPSVVLVNTITPPLWFLLAKLLRIPVVCHVHESEVEQPQPVLRALYLPLYFTRLIIVNSRFSRQVLKDNAPRLVHRTNVVYNGLRGPEQVIPPRMTLERGPRLLFVGRLSTRKGPDVAIRALHVLRQRGVEAHLDIVGDPVPGQEQFARTLHNLIDQLHLGPHVTFHGFRTDVWPHLKFCDIVLVPATAVESFGNTAVEALLAARPVVASRLGGLMEACEGAESARLTQPHSPTQIADSVENLIKDWGDTRLAALRDARVTAERVSLHTYHSRIEDVIGMAAASAVSGQTIQPSWIDQSTDSLPAKRSKKAQSVYRR